MCNKAVDNYAHALEFVFDCYRTHEMFNEASKNVSFTKFKKRLMVTYVTNKVFIDLKPIKCNNLFKPLIKKDMR